MIILRKVTLLGNFVHTLVPYESESYARNFKNLSKLNNMPPIRREVDYHEAIRASMRTTV